MRAPVSRTVAICLSSVTATVGLALTACGPLESEPAGSSLGAPTATEIEHPDTRPGETWPGGTLGGYAEKDGVRVREVAGSGSSGEAGAMDGRASEGAAAPTAGESGTSDGPAEPSDPGAPPVDNNQSGGLEGGEVDDNANFSEFLDYLDASLASYGDDPMVRPVDVTERHLIHVTDANGQRVPDATIRILSGSDGETEIAWGRARADGQFAFFPAAYGAAEDKYIVEADWDQLAARASLRREDAGVDVQFDAALPAAPSRLDVAFVIDCTGSMSEEIDRIKETVTTIAGRIGQDPHHPDLRFGLVAYRDAQDDFVTRTVDFTGDIQAFQGAINQLEAGGGGDEPESVNAALQETMRGLTWRQETATRLAFIVGDAPAHFYEQAPYTYDQAMTDAATMGVKFFPVASGGSNPIAELQFRQLAQFTLGHFVFITEGGGSPVGSGGSDYHVDPQDFQVQSLDELIVRLVRQELAAGDLPD